MREALDSAHDDEVAAHLTRVAQLLARGEAPLELAQHLAGATLHALPKGADDVRGKPSGAWWPSVCALK